MTPFGGHLAREDVHHEKCAPGSTLEYEDEAVKLLINTGGTVAKAAREFGVPGAPFGRWVDAYRERQTAGDGARS